MILSIPEEIKTFVDKKNVSIYTMQAYDSIDIFLYLFGFIDFVLKINRLH